MNNVTQSKTYSHTFEQDQRERFLADLSGHIITLENIVAEKTGTSWLKKIGINASSSDTVKTSTTQHELSASHLQETNAGNEVAVAKWKEQDYYIDTDDSLLQELQKKMREGTVDEHVFLNKLFDSVNMRTTTSETCSEVVSVSEDDDLTSIQTESANNPFFDYAEKVKKKTEKVKKQIETVRKNRSNLSLSKQERSGITDSMYSVGNHNDCANSMESFTGGRSEQRESKDSDVVVYYYDTSIHDYVSEDLFRTIDHADTTSFEAAKVDGFFNSNGSAPEYFSKTSTGTLTGTLTDTLPGTLLNTFTDTLPGTPTDSLPNTLPDAKLRGESYIVLPKTLAEVVDDMRDEDRCADVEGGDVPFSLHIITHLTPPNTTCQHPTLCDV